MKTLREVDVKGQTVLVRVDYNVPLAQTEDGRWRVESDLRVRASLPTIEYLREHGAKKIILMSHLGRPQERESALSLRPVAECLKKLLPEAQVRFVEETTGEKVRDAVAELPEGGVLLLENLRFDPREKQNELELAAELKRDTQATLFVQDGFGATHRAHASTVAIARELPAAAGLLVEREAAGLKKVLQEPARPFVVVIGGAKVADKAPLIEKFLPLADRILVGGKIAADGYEAPAEKVYVAEDFDEDSAGQKLDIGPLATGKFVETLKEAKTVLWNGVLGKVEDVAFATGSEIVAKFLGEHPEMTTVICGGDTAGFVLKLMEQEPELTYSLVSTGGGAALEFLTGGAMPGLEALEWDDGSFC